MKRTAADFLDDARKDDPYAYTIKGRKTATLPRARRHFTPAENREMIAASMRYNKVIIDQDVEEFAKYPQDLVPVNVELRMRFGKDYEAFWTAEGQYWSEGQIAQLCDEIDQHYDPTPADDKTKGAAEDSEVGKAP